MERLGELQAEHWDCEVWIPDPDIMDVAPAEVAFKWPTREYVIIGFEV